MHFESIFFFGNRQYLTGLKLGGERVLIFVDGSASMLADNVVNAIIRRNMDIQQRQSAPKWVWTMSTVEWLLSQLPASSRFQLYIFGSIGVRNIALQFVFDQVLLPQHQHHACFRFSIFTNIFLCSSHGVCFEILDLIRLAQFLVHSRRSALVVGHWSRFSGLVLQS